MAACSKCCRPTQKSRSTADDVRMPNGEDHCVERNGRNCRMVAAGVTADRARIAMEVRKLGFNDGITNAVLRVVEGK